MDNIMCEVEEEIYNTDWDRFNEKWNEREDIAMDDVERRSFNGDNI